MKNKKTLKATCIISAAVVLFVIGSVLLVDKGLNGVFKEWFYKQFTYVYNYPEQGVSKFTFQNWPELKIFFINIFITFVIILVFCSVLISYLYSKHKSKKVIADISRTIDLYINSDNDKLVLSKEYSSIEAQLIKIKATTQKHQQLIHAEIQRKNDLITYLAHDLKTPLASVIGYLCLLNEAPDMPEAQKEKYTGIALQKAYRLEELINEFFDITRFNLQSLVLNKSKIDLSLMLRQMADEFYPMLVPKGRKAAVHAPEGLTLMGDADKLARVFNNILKNAIAYSFENSVIDISAVQREKNIVITFMDHGEPIPPQKLDTIFEKFYRLDSSRSSNTGGAGLGLAIAKEIVTAHNGTITAESNSECTTFTVKLPA